MLGLKLRPEFAGTTISGTVVSLNTTVPDSFLNLSTQEALEITYPTVDTLQALEACFNPESKRYLVIMGDRGQGKSHIMGVIHHAFKDPTVFMEWIEQWKSKITYTPKLIQPPANFLVITVALHEQGYEFLWSPIFAHHPEGARLQGKWEAKRETMPVPAKADIVEALQKKPIALILDEFQTWYSNLQGKPEDWAFNFIQLLSEIARERPDILRLIVSVRNGESEAYKQLHRLMPALVNFQGKDLKQERQKLLIHRMFSNRSQVSNEQIKGAIAIYFNEWCRLTGKTGPEISTCLDQMVSSWPFSLDLLNVLDEQVMVATHAQETRDLLKLLVHLYRSVGENLPIITPAHFGLDEDRNCELDALIAAVGSADIQRLAKHARKNVEAVHEALKETCPSFTDKALASLYVRSISMGNKRGAKREQIQADISVTQKFDDNAFRDHWETIRENSYNMHEKEGLFYFDIPENSHTKVRAHAKNPKLFERGEDIEKIMSMIEYTFAPKLGVDRERFRWTVLSKLWRDIPLRNGAFKGKHPSQDLGDGQPCYVFIPELLDNGNRKAAIGRFLSEHVQRYKNLVRFVIPDRSIFEDKEILFLGRALYFAEQWKADREYQEIANQYSEKLQNALGRAFNKVIILERWDHENHHNISFGEIPIEVRPHQAFSAIDEAITESHFSIDDFNALIEASVQSNHIEKQKLSFLRSILEEPTPFPKTVIPWTNPTHIFEVILRGVIDRRYALQTNSGIIQVSASRTPEQVRRDVQKPQWNRWDTIYVVPLTGTNIGAEIPLADEISAPEHGTIPERNCLATRAIGEITNSNSIARSIKELGYPQNALLALGTIEQWGLNKEAKLHDVSIVFPSLSIDELNRILKAMDKTVQDREMNLKVVVTEEVSR